MDSLLLLEQTLNGLTLGVMLFLMAAGLTLIFGVMGLINLAHGSLYMVGAFVAATVRGFDDMLEGDPAPAFAALQKANALMTPDVMAFSREAMKTLRLVQGDPARGERTGLITRERIARQIEILQSLGQLGKALTVEDVAAFGLAP